MTPKTDKHKCMRTCVNRQRFAFVGVVACYMFPRANDVQSAHIDVFSIRLKPFIFELVRSVDFSKRSQIVRRQKFDSLVFIVRDLFAVRQLVIERGACATLVFILF